MPQILEDIAADPAVRRLAERMSAGSRCAVMGAAGSSTALVAAAVASLAARPLLLVVAHLDDADEALDELTGLGVPALRLPALEALPGETNPSLDLFAERIAVVRELPSLAAPTVLISPLQALMQLVPQPARLEALARTIRTGDRVSPNHLVRWLDQSGYRRVDAVEEPGDFALRGGILDVFPPGAPADRDVVRGVPLRFDFFGDEVERITEIDPDTLGSDRAVPPGAAVQLVCADPGAAMAEEQGRSALELMPRSMLAVLAEPPEVVEQARGYYERVIDARGIAGPPAVLKLLQYHFHALAEVGQFSAPGAGDARVDLPIAPLAHFSPDVAEAMKELADLAAEGRRITVLCQNAGESQRLGELLAEFAPGAPIDSRVAYLHRGFMWGASGGPARGPEHDRAQAPGQGFALVPYHELLNRFTARRRSTWNIRAGRTLDNFLDLQVGDFVVHQEHGIARFIGLASMPPRPLPGRPPPSKAAGEEEYLTLEFAGGSRLHVPALQIDKVQKYIGGFKGKPPLSTVGGRRWETQKERAYAAAKDLAAEMLRVRAAREHVPGVAFPPDTAWQREFEAEFPYEETEDQLAALAEIKKDMSSRRPMDRLLCGDVGFGKTELAIRAAFKAAETGRQAAVLVPTTVLAEQHERTFRARFAGYPFRVESLSRFKTDREQREILEDLARGRVDIVIGTHRLLSRDVAFANLGLVVVDEEQRFGVEHKEALLRLRLTVDVLTLSATPIPRTLHMALLGLRDISSLTTPPADRRAVVTEVLPPNRERIARAIRRELAREGQVFYVHNRIHDIGSVADDVRRLAPDARIVVGHGRMPAAELEEVMLRFMRREADILISTTIIESGIDIPTANTMIIDDADRFGLADLHQLRGRVGRGKHRAYCYLLLPAQRRVTEVAQKRLKAVEQFAMLGAGFKIAMRDLEIRGAGNILGPEQSGHIAAVGYEMYCRLLERAVKELKSGREVEAAGAPSIELGIGASIPRPYIPSDARRLGAYRRLATVATLEELEAFRKDLTDAYGELPRPVLALLEVAEIRVWCAELRVRAVTLREKDVVFRTLDPAPLAERLRRGPGEARVSVLAPKKGEELSEVYLRLPSRALEAGSLLTILRHRLSGARVAAGSGR